MKFFKLKYIVIFIVVIASLVLVITQRNIAKRELKAVNFKKSWGESIEFEDKVNSCDYSNPKDFAKLVNKDLKILEIGAYFAPTFTEGDYVKYFDVLDRDGLLKKAAEENMSIENIPNIDYVDPNGDLSIVKEKFDVVYSSHNIEHQVNLIEHLKQVSAVLNENGAFYLVVPDKRYCFDRFVGLSTLSEILANYEEKPNVHSLRDVLAFDCETTANYAPAHWEGLPSSVEGLECYNKSLRKFEKANGSYIDVHKWRFTPQSFNYIITGLNKIGITDFKVEKIFCTRPNSLEFFAVLKKTKK
jgi:SAM-dependent methyltransferase